MCIAHAPYAPLLRQTLNLERQRVSHQIALHLRTQDMRVYGV